MTDRDIDALVAEKVMGSGCATPPCRDRRLGYSCGCCYPVGRYSTDIAAAWQVVEAMREKSWWLNLRQVPGKSGEWRAVFDFGGMAPTGARPYREAVAATAPLAISLAALRVVGVDTKRMEAQP